MAALAMPTNSSAPPQTHRVSGQGRNVSDEGVKRAVSRRVWPPRHRGDSGMANTAAPKDSTARAAKDGPVWFHCSAPAVRYEGKRVADSACANHSENEPSMKGLIKNDDHNCKSFHQTFFVVTGPILFFTFLSLLF